MVLLGHNDGLAYGTAISMPAVQVPLMRSYPDVL